MEQNNVRLYFYIKLNHKTHLGKVGENDISFMPLFCLIFDLPDLSYIDKDDNFLCILCDIVRINLEHICWFL